MSFFNTLLPTASLSGQSKSRTAALFSQTGQLLAQAAVNRFCRRMGEIFSQRSINRQTLSRDSYASRTAEPFKFGAPTVNFSAVSASHLIAVDYHLRIIII